MEFGLHPLYVAGRVRLEKLYGCNPAPQVVALVAEATLVAIDEADEETELADDTTLETALTTPELVLLARELVADAVELAEPLRAADTAELRLASSAEFTLALTGTKVELTMDTLVMTDWGTELVRDDVALLGVTKLRLVVATAEEDLTEAVGFFEVL